MSIEERIEELYLEMLLFNQENGWVNSSHYPIEPGKFVIRVTDFDKIDQSPSIEINTITKNREGYLIWCKLF